MKIKDDVFLTEERAKTKAELIQLLMQPSDQQERPCPGCRLSFPDDPSITSTSHCSMACPEAAKKMSSDPINHPIEPNAVPIVYAIYSLRLLMPCWSCEGHVNQRGELNKPPKIWFYSVSPFYAKLVAQALSAIKYKEKLHVDWSVKILPFSQSMFTLTYSIEPDITEGDEKLLSCLQQDMHTIGTHLRSYMLRDARKYVANANNSPFSSNT